MNPSTNDPDTSPDAAPSFWVAIPAAGIGARMLADRPKQYLGLHGRTVLEHALACFDGHPRVRGIVLSIALDDPYWSSLVLKTSTPVHLVPGGTERADSVLQALELLDALAEGDDWVLVHDAARPCLTREDLDRLIETVEQDAVGGILAVPVRDTMKRANAEGRIARTEARNGLWHALTPQMFRLGLLRSSLIQARERGLAVTDEASAMELAGHAPMLVEGRADNIKITRPEDLALAEFFLSRAAGAHS
ncbi:MAG: 2-C-methyl-D-erythritol 4-phosphate cytidylyltransferase [Halothiobacillaceae bacterium]|nr:MAG: 2-C-methyl-D-erythritol 4-phosphate cytidylyltransferase [Halothiobacillaceae bacterium]